MDILSFHFDFPYIRTCLIRKKRKGVEIRSLKVASNLEDVKQLYIQNFKGRIVTGLSAKDFLIRSMEAKILRGRQMEEALVFKAEALSHLNPEEILTVPLLRKKKEEALVFTVLRERLKTHLSTLKTLKIDPDVVSTVPSALCGFIRWKFPNLQEAFIVDLGSKEITCALLEDGELKKSHVIEKGVENLLDALYEDRKRTLLKKEVEGAARQIDLLLVKEGLNPHLFVELSDIRQELARVYYSFHRESPKVLLLTGRVDAFIHLDQVLSPDPLNRKSTEVSLPDLGQAFPSLRRSPHPNKLTDREDWQTLSVEEQKFAVSIGLCLEEASDTPLQLRRGEFFPEKNWARMGLYGLALLAGSCLLSFALWTLGIQSQAMSKQKMLESLERTSIQQFSSKGPIEKQIDQWISAIETNMDEYPYILQSPKATQVLAWLSSHPLLKELEQEKDPIDLKEFKYQLVSFPTIHSEKDRFVAKIELEFNFKSPMHARKFHESLRAGDDWIDPKLEITWDALEQGYRTTFFMKNRRPYVP